MIRRLLTKMRRVMASYWYSWCSLSSRNLAVNCTYCGHTKHTKFSSGFVLRQLQFNIHSMKPLSNFNSFEFCPIYCRCTKSASQRHVISQMRSELAKCDSSVSRWLNKVATIQSNNRWLNSWKRRQPVW